LSSSLALHLTTSKKCRIPWESIIVRVLWLTVSADGQSFVISVETFQNIDDLWKQLPF